MQTSAMRRHMCWLQSHFCRWDLGGPWLNLGCSAWVRGTPTIWAPGNGRTTEELCVFLKDRCLWAEFWSCDAQGARHCKVPKLASRSYGGSSSSGHLGCEPGPWRSAHSNGCHPGRSGRGRASKTFGRGSWAATEDRVLADRHNRGFDDSDLNLFVNGKIFDIEIYWVCTMFSQGVDGTLTWCKVGYRPTRKHISRKSPGYQGHARAMLPIYAYKWSTSQRYYVLCGNASSRKNDAEKCMSASHDAGYFRTGIGICAESCWIPSNISKRCDFAGKKTFQIPCFGNRKQQLQQLTPWGFGFHCFALKLSEAAEPSSRCAHQVLSLRDNNPQEHSHPSEGPVPKQRKRRPVNLPRRVSSIWLVYVGFPQFSSSNTTLMVIWIVSCTISFGQQRRRVETSRERLPQLPPWCARARIFAGGQSGILDPW